MERMPLPSATQASTAGLEKPLGLVIDASGSREAWESRWGKAVLGSQEEESNIYLFVYLKRIP